MLLCPTTAFVVGHGQTLARRHDAWLANSDDIVLAYCPALQAGAARIVTVIFTHVSCSPARLRHSSMGLGRRLLDGMMLGWPTVMTLCLHTVLPCRQEQPKLSLLSSNVLLVPPLAYVLPPMGQARRLLNVGGPERPHTHTIHPAAAVLHERKGSMRPA